MSCQFRTAVARMLSGDVLLLNCMAFFTPKKYLMMHDEKKTILVSFVIKCIRLDQKQPGRVAQSVGHLTRRSEVQGSIPGLAAYFRFSFR